MSTMVGYSKDRYHNLNDDQLKRCHTDRREGGTRHECNHFQLSDIDMPGIYYSRLEYIESSSGRLEGLKKGI